MSDTTKKLTIQETLDRIEKLNQARKTVENKTVEVETHEKDLKAQEVVSGVNTDAYKVKKELLDNAKHELEVAENEVNELSFKKSELKPVFEEIAKKFEDELRSEQEREFHIEIGSLFDEENDTDETWKEKQVAGRKAFKNLMEYLYKNITWTAKTAPGLMVLVRNMEDNKYWVRDKEFDNTISLRSSNILVLWRSIIEEMQGKGYYEARAFLECWATCGKGISDSVREIQKLHEDVRKLGTQLNTIEDEFINSVDDLPAETEMTIAEEVDPMG